MLSVVSHLCVRDYVPNIFCKTTFNSDGYCDLLLFFPQSKLTDRKTKQKKLFTNKLQASRLFYNYRA
jgi:hypothetical protein